MLMTIEGLYRNGKIELSGMPGKQFDDTPVIVIFLTKLTPQAETFVFNEGEATELRVRLIAFAENWDNPDIDIYDAETKSQLTRHRRPHPDIAGKGRTLGDLVNPLVDEADWACFQ